MSIRSRLRKIATVYSDTKLRLEVVELLPGETTETARDRLDIPLVAENGLPIIIIGLS